jgi:hypothetical protein
MTLGHEKPDVYRLSIDYVALGVRENRDTQWRPAGGPRSAVSRSEDLGSDQATEDLGSDQVNLLEYSSFSSIKTLRNRL